MKFWGATMSHHQPTAAATRSPAKMSSMSGRGATRPIRSLVFAALAPFVAGCAIHPLPDDVTRETTYSIVQKVRCEAQRGLLEGEGRWLRDGTVAYDFTFNINEKNGAGGGFTLTDPFKSGTFTLTGTAKADRTRLANRNFKVIDSFAELRATNCSQEALEKNWIYPLAGDVGMYEAIATFAKLQKVDNPEAGKLFTFADTLTFTTTFEGGLTGRVTLSPVTNRLRFTEGNLNVGASRTDVHQVIVTASAGPQVASRRGFRAFVGGVGAPGNTLLATTVLQQSVGHEDRALYELDRQQTLDFIRRGLLVGAP
jgi:hypothetical protein